MANDNTPFRIHPLDQDMYRKTLNPNDTGLSAADREMISARARDLITDIRAKGSSGLMEVFLAEYGLSTDEGVALMCLAEALLRVPDSETIDALIEDKIAPSDWAKHLGRSSSPLVNASTWGLMLTGRVLDPSTPGPAGHLRAAIKRLGEPVIRTAVSRAMKEMGRQFVLGETIEDAMARAATEEARGYTYSYDMLGEAALTHADAERYQLAYAGAITAIAKAATSSDIRDNPGISVKLSALHPRYERSQRDAVLRELTPKLLALAIIAKSAGVGLNIDAEEASRLSLSMEVIQAALSDSSLSGWNGFGIVVQAYSPRSGRLIDDIYDMAKRYDRKVMVRLVKGAYWDTEIKRAQVLGVEGFPVFTRKAETDVNYLIQARKLLSYHDRIYPQFATHNAHSAAAILHMAEGLPFEFQRLHGMGEALHEILHQGHGTRCRIYAPVGAHRDLLAYLVRRLLENGANSSFVNQLTNDAIPAADVAADPIAQLAEANTAPPLPTGPELFLPHRKNAQGFDLDHTPTLGAIEDVRAPFVAHRWSTQSPLTDGTMKPSSQMIISPTDPDDEVGTATWIGVECVPEAMANATLWDATPEARREALGRAASLFEAHHNEIFALLAREAGKTLPDAVAELREAVDFLRFYALHASKTPPVGKVLCISPWNFPLAIFTGQIAAALACGNAVLAKPAEQTPLIAALAVELIHRAGVPALALQLLPGDGAVGAALVSAGPDAVAFTGSTATALQIRAALARDGKPGTPLIAETGGLNAMIVDSTALPEQAVTSIIESAFQSAGQRCSALRCLYVQEDIFDDFVTLLTGAMDTLRLGDPWRVDTDVGPVIDQQARDDIAAYIAVAESDGRVLHRLAVPTKGWFIAPTLIRVDGIAALDREVFGPVLHIATFKNDKLDDVIADINATGYGLTFGLHTRIDDRVQHMADRIEAGNIYVNRNQIGAIVGSQPFGGHGLSGTGPKAGGQDYLLRFRKAERPAHGSPSSTANEHVPLPACPAGHGETLSVETLPGPTGESNTLRRVSKPALLCLGPGSEAISAQVQSVETLGGIAVRADGMIKASDLTSGPEYGGVLWWGDSETARAYDLALAARKGPIIPLITGLPDRAHVAIERHLCVDTTASGGNASLLGNQ